MAFDINTLLFLGLLYLLLLFAIAFATEKQLLPQALIEHPAVYVLSLGVYASAFAYYGVTGLAKAYGMSYLNYYLGISAALFLLPVLIAPLHHVCKSYRLNSIADILSFRFRSQWVGSLSTIISGLAITPILAVQIQTVSNAASTLTTADPLSDEGSIFRRLTGIAFCVIISVFTILFGSRSLSSKDSHRGLVTALAFESLVKLIAFLVLGVVAVVSIFGGFSDMQAWLAANPQLITSMAEANANDSGRMMLLLFFAAAICMPHVFHMLFAENSSSRNLVSASWGLPLYLFLISLPVLPLLWSNAAIGADMNGDYAALNVLNHLDSPALTLLVFIGGISAASGVIIVSTLALASMWLNHLVLPWQTPQKRDINIYNWLLLTRQCLIVAAIFTSYLLYEIIPDRKLLSDLALVSVAGCAQLLPGLLATLYWPNANRNGFIAGLLTGLTLWITGTLLPILGLAPPAIIQSLLDASAPETWLSFAGITLALNGIVFVGVSLLTETSKEERSAAEACTVDDLNRPSRQALNLKSAMEMRSRLAETIGHTVAKQEVNRALNELQLSINETRPYALRRLRDRIEINLSALVGPSNARRVIDRSLPYTGDIAGDGEDINYIEDRLERYQTHLTGLAADLDGLRRYHRQTLENLPTGVCALGADSEILLWNKSMASITGIHSAEITGSALGGLPNAWRELLVSFCASPDDHWNKYSLELEGTPRWLNLHKTESKMLGRNELIVVIEDITDTQLLEKELGHQERLASIGRLAAGVAHEIGNPVTGIASLAQNLRYETEDPALLETAEQIVKQTRRISTIVQSLVNFAHNGRDDPTRAKEAVSVAQCVNEAIQLLSFDKEAKKVHYDNACDPCIAVAGDYQRLTQVFINLLTNARDASPEGSTIRIDADSLDTNALIRVVDQGEGIPPDIAEHIFEPFFTTKEPGKGTGLGLALVYRIINDLNGDISVKSPVSDNGASGSCFQLQLPLACHIQPPLPTSSNRAFLEL
ncbi:PAS domain-containing protein [Spongiibacter sp. KMU-166]|uniref:histidine kinase n=1 Tax=Spongiibacter thalassae TaxID=2721624 RepID=A0ABX1GGF4_9GAMM|nr:ATP-binding protein [Spongiibacter thalassae]NKI18001.1 PAS domain-containing protein [Spongiibacter thalassae]